MPCSRFLPEAAARPGVRPTTEAAWKHGTARLPKAFATGDRKWKKPRGAISPMTRSEHPTTPDGRYFVVRGRLWRKANLALCAQRREALVKQLMEARRALRSGHSDAERAAARRSVDEAKRGLGERGPVWWDDGSPDYNRRMAGNTPYADWFSSLQSVARDDA